MDFGVVVVGPNPIAQLKLLRTRLLDELGALAMGERNLEVGTASQFQGAERNVMFLSLIVAPEAGERIRIWPHEHTGRNRRNVQQLNVAGSRARDQLWIFHSFEPAQLPPGDARAVLFETAPLEVAPIEKQLEACQSKFERDVVAAIAAADDELVIRTQVEALGYAIDIVVEDRYGHRLAVECDGDRWHSEDGQIRSDLYRQRTLENIGWRFHRFLASEWYEAPDRHLQAILDELSRAEAPQLVRSFTAGERSEATRDSLRQEPPEVRDRPDEEVDDQWHWDSIDDGDAYDEELDDELFGWSDDGWPEEEDDQLGPELSEETGPLFVDRSAGDEAIANRRSWPQATDATESLTCESCGQVWTRKVVRGRKPSRCPACQTSTPTLPGLMQSQRLPEPERETAQWTRADNRLLASALREAGKQRNGTVWARAKALVEAGYSIEDAAREA